MRPPAVEMCAVVMLTSKRLPPSTPRARLGVSVTVPRAAAHPATRTVILREAAPTVGRIPSSCTPGMNEKRFMRTARA
jgi:hypothetical protein